MNNELTYWYTLTFLRGITLRRKNVIFVNCFSVWIDKVKPDDYNYHHSSGKFKQGCSKDQTVFKHYRSITKWRIRK